MSFNLRQMVRPNIRDLKPYSSARSEFSGTARIFLDANENAFGSPAGDGNNRYPDPLQTELKQRIAEIKDVSPEQIFVGNGSDEAIDLLYRVFCEPGRDSVIVCPPTYGMYGVSAAINDIGLVEVPLTVDFQLDVAAVKQAITARTKLIFVCSPNNPTGNLMKRGAVIELAEDFEGLVVVDEAYIDFADSPSLTNDLETLPDLVVLQTFSKAWGMAGLRIGLAFANEEVIDLMNRVKPPYNVSGIAQHAVIESFKRRSNVAEWISSVRSERAALCNALAGLDFVRKIYPSDANFILVKVAEAHSLYTYLLECGIVVRDRSTVELCGECLRITIGTQEENATLLEALSTFRSAGVSPRK